MQEILNRLPLKDAALFYARAGWPVFPLAGKIPYEGMHGHRDATTDRAQSQTWWSEHPKANIGLATGNNAGILVLDMDVPKGYFGLKELQEHYGKLPPTRTGHTAGGGLHYYFQYPQDGNTYPNTVGLLTRSALISGQKEAMSFYHPQNSTADSPTPGQPMTHPLLPFPTGSMRFVANQRRTPGIPARLALRVPFGRKVADGGSESSHRRQPQSVGFWLACQLRDDGLTARSMQHA